MHGNGRSAPPAVPPEPVRQPQQHYYAQHDFQGTAQLTTTLVHALSNVTGADVTEAEAVLEDHLDARALDVLFRPRPDGTPRASCHLGFTAWGHEVTVYSDGQITIVPCQQQPPAPQQ